MTTMNEGAMATITNAARHSREYTSPVTFLMGTQRAEAVQMANSFLMDERDKAEAEAWKALRRYKFQMFGYWAAIWVHMNRLCLKRKPNPWRDLVKLAKERA